MTQTQQSVSPKVNLVPIKIAQPLMLYEFRVEGATAAHRGVDVLFIHGLTGDPITTWGDWPKKLASQFSDRATVWSLGYPAPLFERQLGTIEKYFSTEGHNALTELLHAGLGKKPIVFVTHSLGGLLAKAIIAKAKVSRGSSEYSLFANTHAVIFAATPHAGSGQARWRLLVPAIVSYAAKGLGALIAAGALAWLSISVLSITVFGHTWQVKLAGIVGALSVLILGAILKSVTLPGRHVVMLDPSNPALAHLTSEFRKAQFQRKFAVDSFYEEKKLWGLFLVVPQWSADPGITDSEPVGIPAHHIGICKEPNEMLLKRAIEQRVEDCLRGKEKPVFQERLERLLKEQRERDAFATLFKGQEGQRDKAEVVFRTFVRNSILNGEFELTGPELDLARDSSFDEDILVWSLWHEVEVARVIRHLRDYGSRELESDFRSTQSISGRTVIPFYRVLRTIEHLLSGDLPVPGYTSELDRDLLLQTTNNAFKRLQDLAVDGVDGDGQTRRAILRLSSVLLLARAAQEKIGRGKYQERGENLTVALHNQKDTIDKAVARFEKPLSSA